MRQSFIVFVDAVPIIMGRKWKPGGIRRMSFSFSHRTASLVESMKEDYNRLTGGRHTVSATHIVSMAIHQWSRMRARGAWSCRGPPEGMFYCGHLNSITAPTCEICATSSPDVIKREERQKADALLAEKYPDAGRLAAEYKAKLEKERNK